MKNAITKITALSILVIFMGCSSDDNSDGSVVGGNFKPLKSILMESSGSSSSAIYFDYENNRLEKMALQLSSNIIYLSFEYNSLGKVSSIINYSDSDDDNTTEVDFDNELNFNGESSQYTQHYYENGKLVKIDFVNSEGGADKLYQYDEEGRLVRISCSQGCSSSNTYFYSDGKITSYTVEYSDETFITKVEFDDKINPFHEMFKAYGIDFELYSGLFNFREAFYSKNNLNKAEDEGMLEYYATYEYDSDGYPTFINYNYPGNGDSGTAILNY